MTRTLYFPLLLALLFPFGLSAQNLIPNPGFEQYRRCPQTLGNFEEDLFYWSCPTRGSTDFFHQCSPEMGAPENFNGKQEPAEGKAYAGFYAYAPSEYREYVQVRLYNPLKGGKTYRFSAALSLAERSDYSLAQLGVLFSNHPLREGTRKVLSSRRRMAHPGNRYTYIDLPTNKDLSAARHWVRLETTFQAKGGEAVLILGNFETDQRTRKTRRKGSNKGAYYYLDALSLVALDSLGVPEPLPKFSLDSLQTLPTVVFEFDSHNLSTIGKERLNALGQFLRSDHEYSLELRGHTDNVGEAPYNQALSERRCHSVSSYLEELGISRDRISYRGFGASRPISSNRDSLGRQKNRRVEFIIHSARDSLRSDGQN